MRVYILLNILFLLQQTIVGGLFFIVAENLIAEKNYPLLMTIFALTDPIIMLFIGKYISRGIDLLRIHDLQEKTNYYIAIALAEALLLILFGTFFLINHTLGLCVYALWQLSYLSSKIYRQRFTRDYAEFKRISFERLNAVWNFAARGSPLLSPLVLLVFDPKNVLHYISVAVVVSIISSFSFFFYYKKILLKHKKPLVKKEISHKEHTLNIAWAKWHMFHLGFMNFAFASTFFVLGNALSLSTDTSLTRFFHSPTPLYLGFWIMIAYLAIKRPKKSFSFMTYLYLIFLMGFLFCALPYFENNGKALLLFTFGLLFGRVINKISTTVQSKFDAKRFSETEIRAQFFGRIGAISSITLAGLMLENGFSINAIETTIGLLGMLGAMALMLAYQKLIQKHPLK